MLHSTTAAAPPPQQLHQHPVPMATATATPSTTPSAKEPLVDPTNPIFLNYDLGSYVGSCGPELVWRLYDGWRKPTGGNIGHHGHHHHGNTLVGGGQHPLVGGGQQQQRERERKEVTLFIYNKKLAEKLHKPKRKETIAEILRSSFRQLERFRHPKILQIYSNLEESSESIAFASEPLRGCLSQLVLLKSGEFLELEYKYGLLNLTEALQFLHYSGHVVHRNVCPSSVVVTKRGVWKLAGMEFMEKCHEAPSPSSTPSTDLDPIPSSPWSSRLPKMGQPDLDFIAPEIQLSSSCSILSDMFSLGLLIVYVYSGGGSLIRAKYSSSCYGRQVEQLDSELSTLLPCVPLGLQEAVTRLLSREPRQRPTSQLLSLIKYFADPVVHALQFLDVIQMKDPAQKAGFYRNGLRDVLPFVPRKLLFAHIWPILQLELRTTEVLAAALQPILYIVQEASVSEFDEGLLPAFRSILTTPKSIQASVTLLENLSLVLEKSRDEEFKSELMGLVYTGMESSTVQVQNASLIATTNCSIYIPTATVKSHVLPKTKLIYTKNPGDVRIMLNVLNTLEQILDKLERGMIIEEVLPILVEVKLQDPDVCWRVVQIYRRLLSSKQYGLSFNLLATKVIPSLIPQTINPSLSLEQFTCLVETIQEMLDCIERNQRNKLKLDCLSPSNVHGNASSRRGSEAPGRGERKASSAEDVGVRSSLLPDHPPHLTSLSTSTTPTSENFLRVAQQPAYRRLSDNTLLPTIKLAVDELPIRRHSSTGPESGGGGNRKNSVAAVVQEAARGGKPTSASASAVNAAGGSRRPSTAAGAAAAALQPSNLLTQLGSGIGAFLHKNIPR